MSSRWKQQTVYVKGSKDALLWGGCGGPFLTKLLKTTMLSILRPHQLNLTVKSFRSFHLLLPLKNLMVSVPSHIGREFQPSEEIKSLLVRHILETVFFLSRYVNRLITFARTCDRGASKTRRHSKTELWVLLHFEGFWPRSELPLTQSI